MSKMNLSRRGLLKVSAALVAGLALATIAVVLQASQTFTPSNELVFATADGEIRTVSLDDGSSIELNTNTDISVVYNTKSRTADLRTGYFDEQYAESQWWKTHWEQSEMTTAINGCRGILSELAL